MRPLRPAAFLAGLLLSSAFAFAQDPPAPDPAKDPNAAGGADADKEKKARSVIHEKLAAKVGDLVKAADADANSSLSEAEFAPLPKQAQEARAEIVKAVYAELGLPEPAKKDAGAAGGRKGGGKKAGGGGGKKGGGKKAGGGKAKPDEASKAAEAFKKADADGDGKVTFDEAKAALTGGK